MTMPPGPQDPYDPTLLPAPYVPPPQWQQAPPYPPQPPPMYPPPPYAQQHYVQAAATEREKAGLFQAGKIALWVWILITLVPLAACVGCCLLGGFASIFGAATTPSVH